MSSPPVHFALPLRVSATGRLAGIEQDSAAEVAQSVAVLLTTRVGERVAVPDYGSPAVLGLPALPPAALTGAIESWEPRARGADVVIGSGAGSAAATGAPQVAVTLPAIDGVVLTVTATASD